MRFSTLTIAALIVLASSANAYTIYFGHDDPRNGMINSRHAEQAFKTALRTFGTETFDGLPTWPNDPAATNPTLTFGATGVGASVTETIVANTGPMAVSSPNWLYEYLAGDEVFTLSRPVDGFGAFILDAGTIAGESILIWKLENIALGTSKTITVGNFLANSPGNVAYIGVVDRSFAFDRVSAFTTNTTDLIGYDDLTVGFVPEPGSMILLACIFGFLALRRVLLP
jgi:hypothetical protein